MSGEGVHNITSAKEFHDILESGEAFMLDCFATWCAPCKVIAPHFAKRSNEHQDIKFYKLDVDEIADIAQELNITAMPTFLAFKDGKRVDIARGANPGAIDQLIQKIK